MSIWQPASTIIYLSKMINTIYKDNLEKPTAMFLLLNFSLPLDSLMVKPKQKDDRGRLVIYAKQAKKA